MILLDPDLESAPRRGLRGQPPSGFRLRKGAAEADPPKVDRNGRVPTARTLSLFLHKAQKEVRLRGLVSVLLTTDKAIRRLNRTFRGKDKATDVLSFPAAELSRGEVAGDLAISVPTALKQAREHGHPLGVEIKVLMLHGLLHLAGYDHEADTGQMARRERVLRERLRLPVGLIERSVGHGKGSGGERTGKGSSLSTPAQKTRKHGASRAGAASGRKSKTDGSTPPDPAQGDRGRSIVARRAGDRRTVRRGRA